MLVVFAILMTAVASFILGFVFAAAALTKAGWKGPDETKTVLLQE